MCIRDSGCIRNFRLKQAVFGVIKEMAKKVNIIGGQVLEMCIRDSTYTIKVTRGTPAIVPVTGVTLDRTELTLYTNPVSYTHLDVYKRQDYYSLDGKFRTKLPLEGTVYSRT